MSNLIDLRAANIICDGNSITAGFGSIGAGYPEQLKNMLAKANPTLINAGVSGQTTSQMVNDAPSQIDALFDKSRVNILIAKEGGNDILLNNVSASTAYQTYRDYCILRRSCGFYVVAMGTFKRSDTPAWGTTADFEERLLQYDFLIRQNWRDFADAYIDLRKLLPQFVPGGQYMPDGIHPSPTGYALLANQILGGLRTIKIRKKRIEIMPVTYTFNTAGAIADIVIPSWCTRIVGWTISGGGGGASGRKGAAGSARFGGGGGSGSGYVPFDYAIADLGLTPGVSVISGQVGAGGNGGAAVTANSTNGNAGSAGTQSFIRIGSSGTNYICYNPLISAGGNGGTSTAANGGTSVATVFQGNNGAASSASANPSNAPNSNYAAAGGGAGGGISTGNVAFAGSRGGRALSHIEGNRAGGGLGGANTGGGGGAATKMLNSNNVAGDGAGGGGANLTGNGGNGAPGRAGSGGGGGGAAVDGVGNSGAGGRGGDGIVQITFY